jgi:hypothetical protein
MLAALLLPQILHAAEDRANLMIIPGRVIMDNNSAFTTIVLKNSGYATGNYSLELVDMRMLEDGSVVPLEPGQAAQYSAKSYLHVAPRSLSLKPGEIKRLQLALRKPPALENGEYRAHLKIWLVDDNADAVPASVVTAKTVTLAIKANMVMIIPVIYRHGNTNYTMQIESPKLSRNAAGAPVLDMYLRQEGNRSSMGDISVDYISLEGKSQKIAFFPGVPVYRETPRRFISVPLDVPKGVNLATGSLKITYTKPEEENGVLMAETALQLQ